MEKASEWRKYLNRNKKTLKAWYYDDLWYMRLETVVGYKRKKLPDIFEV